MPTPTVAAPPKERALPANLDELVRRAMSGQGVGELQKALVQSGHSAPAAPPLLAAPAGTRSPQTEPVAPAPPPVLTQTVPLVPPVSLPAAAAVAPPTVFPTSNGANIDSALVALVTAASRALAAHAAGNTRELSAALDEAAGKIASVRATLAPKAIVAATPLDIEPLSDETLDDLDARALAPTSAADEAAERTVRLPPIRHPFALILGAAPSGSELGPIATALGVDLATARNVALANGTRITLRGSDRAELERRAASVRLLGITAGVCARDQLSQLGPAWAVVGFDSPGRWRIVATDIWVDPPDLQNLPLGEGYALIGPRVLVVGEVEVRRLRAETAESKWQRKHLSPAKGAGGESRMAVLDLIFPDRVLRVVEGAFDIRGFAGGDPTSARRSIKSVQEWLTHQFPSLRVEPRRICSAAPIAGISSREDGWAAWEEHSRACALLAPRESAPVTF